MALVSVVMPVFNSAEVLREQLISLVRQDFRSPWELIAADNGSSDASLKVIDEFAGELPVRIIDASARSGSAAARNLGAAAATGDLILFCDSDDAVDPHWISSHLACLSDADISIGPYEMRTDMALAESGSYVSVPMRGTYGFLPYGLSANMGIRRSTFDVLGGFDEMYPAAGDVDICWRAQLQGLALGVTEDAVVTKRKRHRASDVWLSTTHSDVTTFGCTPTSDDTACRVRSRWRSRPTVGSLSTPHISSITHAACIGSGLPPSGWAVSLAISGIAYFFSSRKSPLLIGG